MPPTPPLTLDQLAQDPAAAVHLSLGQARAFWLRAHSVLGALAPILLAPSPTLPTEDRLLTVDEAAAKLGCSQDWLYRHAKQLSFTVRPTPGSVRFSFRGIEQYIRRRTGAQGGPS